MSKSMRSEDYDGRNIWDEEDEIPDDDNPDERGLLEDVFEANEVGNVDEAHSKPESPLEKGGTESNAY